MNEYAVEKIKRWLPLILFVGIVTFYGTIRCTRLYKLKKGAKAYFMEKCPQELNEDVCQEKLSQNHKKCYDKTLKLVSTGYRTTRYTLSQSKYYKCVMNPNKKK